jgi:hypothetical protein
MLSPVDFPSGLILMPSKFLEGINFYICFLTSNKSALLRQGFRFL